MGGRMLSVRVAGSPRNTHPERKTWKMTDFTAHTHPVLAVACPDCRKRSGAMCIRPSGHRASDFHMSRKAEADRAFIDRHGPDASIEDLYHGPQI